MKYVLSFYDLGELTFYYLLIASGSRGEDGGQLSFEAFYYLLIASVRELITALCSSLDSFLLSLDCFLTSVATSINVNTQYLTFYYLLIAS